MAVDLNTKIQTILDEQLPLVLGMETKSELTLFDSCARTIDGALSEIVVWIRSFDIQEHAENLIKKLPIDPVVRKDIACNGAPRQKGDTVIIRFRKELPNDVDLLLELFQVYGEDEEAAEALTELNGISN